MSTEILKDFLIAVGFKLDEGSYKRASEAVEKVEKQVSENERRDQTRVTTEQRRHEIRKRNAEGLALEGVTDLGLHQFWRDAVPPCLPVRCQR